MQQTYRYRNIIIKPHCMQFVINELHLLVLISVGFVYAGIDDAVLSTFVFVLSLLLSLCLAYRMAYLCRMRYIISNEQLVFEHGVFHREGTIPCGGFQRKSNFHAATIPIENREHIFWRQNDTKA